MPAGTLVSRQWVLVLHNGVIVIDWGNDLFQDVDTGEFLKIAESRVSYTAQDADMERLKRTSRVDAYDSQQAWFIGLPERPFRLLD